MKKRIIVWKICSSWKVVCFQISN